MSNGIFYRQYGFRVRLNKPTVPDEHGTHHTAAVEFILIYGLRGKVSTLSQHQRTSLVYSFNGERGPCEVLNSVRFIKTVFKDCKHPYFSFA